MANVIYNSKVVGQLLIDPAGTNMGVEWVEGCDIDTRELVWNKFMTLYPTGRQIENKDVYIDISLST
jgi:hypothetical protein